MPALPKREPDYKFRLIGRHLADVWQEGDVVIFLFKGKENDIVYAEKILGKKYLELSEKYLDNIRYIIFGALASEFKGEKS